MLCYLVPYKDICVTFTR